MREMVDPSCGMHLEIIMNAYTSCYTKAVSTQHEITPFTLSGRRQGYLQSSNRHILLGGVHVTLAESTESLVSSRFEGVRSGDVRLHTRSGNGKFECSGGFEEHASLDVFHRGVVQCSQPFLAEHPGLLYPSVFLLV